jgi:predicted nucleotidyltransferase component of viral defense system
MRDFLSLSEEERLSLMMDAAGAMGISPLLIEKDFWVCWVLRHLFSLEIREDLVFKGGTSLSKTFSIIQRMSEDIDVTIDKRKLGYDPEQIKTSSKTTRHLEVLEKRAKEYIEKHILDKLKAAFLKTPLSTVKQMRWKLETDLDNSFNVRFYYPSLIQLPGSDYFRQSVLIEFGMRGEMEPHEMREVTSYIQEFVGAHKLYEPIIGIKVLSPARTFFEKLTLIHAENHRPQGKEIPDRLSRHYYDIFQLIEKGIADQTIHKSEISLLYDVIHHKTVFFRSSWASYATAVPETISLYPNETLKEALKKDYKMTQQMIFGKPPAFDDIMEKIKVLEMQLRHMRP